MHHCATHSSWQSIKIALSGEQNNICCLIESACNLRVKLCMNLSVMGMCEKHGKLSVLRNMSSVPVTLFLHGKSVRKLVTTHGMLG